MTSDFEVQVSPQYLAKIEADFKASVKMLAAPGAFTDYNRGGGPKGDYDRHYDKSTGGVMPGPGDRDSP